jgi:CHASE2 domain-containing sensor protein
VEGHFDQMGPTFIRDMLILLSINFVGYLALWNLRKMGVVILGIAGAALCGYGFYIGHPILLNFIPLLAALTTAPMWPVLKTP